MKGIIYLLWLAVPFSLFILGIVQWMLGFVFPSGPDESIRRKKLFRRANLSFLGVLICVLIDQGVIQAYIESGSNQGIYFRVLLFPIVILVGWGILVAISKGRGRRDFVSYDQKVRGSNPLIILFEFLLFALLVIEKPNIEEPNKETKGILGKTSESLMRPLEMLGLRKKQDKKPRSIQLPNFNQEAYLRFRDMVEEISVEEKVDPLLISAIIEISSGYNQNLESSSGALGLMQLPEVVLRAHGASMPLSVRQNVRAGCRYLRHLLTQFNERLELALVAFRIGEEVIFQQGGIPPNSEAEAFMEEVINHYEIAKAQK